MGQWGNERFGANTQPNWFKDLSTAEAGYEANNVIYDRPNHPAADENLLATERGWERVITYTDSSGATRTKREVVVAQGDLANTLAFGANTTVSASVDGSPEIVDIRWGTGNTATGLVSGTPGGDGFLYTTAEAVNVVVTFSEAVYLDESSGRATANIAATSTAGGDGNAFLTAYVLSGNGTNKLTFSNTVGKTSGETLSITDDHTQPFITLGSAVLTAVANNLGGGTPVAFVQRSANISTLGVGTLAGAAQNRVDARTGATLGGDAGARKVK